MAIFCDLKLEPLVQVSDKTRLDASRSFIAKGDSAITLVEIEPDTGVGYVDVTGDGSKDWYLDWAYSTEGTKTVTVRITTDGDPVTLTKTLGVLTESSEKLLSKDADIISLESDVMSYLPEGFSSYNYVHRKALGLILEYLDRQGYKDDAGAPLTKDALVEKEAFNAWSKFMALRLIYFDLSNQVDDIFWKKAEYYRTLEESARNRAEIPLDTNGDTVIDESERNTMGSIRMRVE